MGDSSRIEQVLTNLIGNAVSYTESGGCVGISVIDRGISSSIEIENSGSKIPEDELDIIWQKFYRLDKSRSRDLGGTGLGLSIVKEILELHHSSFGVKNTDTGILFNFSLKKAD